MDPNTNAFDYTIAAALRSVSRLNEKIRVRQLKLRFSWVVTRDDLYASFPDEINEPESSENPLSDERSSADTVFSSLKGRRAALSLNLPDSGGGSCRAALHCHASVDSYLGVVGRAVCFTHKYYLPEMQWIFR